MANTIVITGGSGFLGMNMALKVCAEWNTHLLYRHNPVKIVGTYAHPIELEDIDKTNKIIEKIRPDLIVHTAGLTDIELCEKKKFEAYCSNVLSARHIAQVAKNYACQLVHISTDHFSKSSEPMSGEDSIEIPLNYYSLTKLEAEYEIKKFYPDALIIRSNFFGWGNRSGKSFSDFVINNLRQGKSISLFDDVFYTPILVDSLTDSLFSLFKRNVKGIFNVVGDNRLSKYDFGIKIAEIFNLDKNLIKKISIKSLKHLETRPSDMSLSNEKLKSFVGDIDLSLETGIKKLKSQEEERKRLICLPEKIPLIHYGKQSIDDTDILSVMKTLNSPFITQGPKAMEFEKEVASYAGAKYAVSACNWTSGLHLACLAAGVGPGDSVLTSPLSFVASSNCALYVGAAPAFADINLETLNIDPCNVEKKCRELGNVKAIVPVHFGGTPCDMQALGKIADKYGAVIIEDAAHALGGRYHTGEIIGSCAYSLMSGFSFHPVKNITTGEGCVITTNDKSIYDKLIKLRSHGITKNKEYFQNAKEAFTGNEFNPWYYEMQELGFNYRITDIQCSLGISQIKRLDGLTKRRLEISQKYDRAFEKLKYLKILQKEVRHLSGNHIYVVMIDHVGLGKSRPSIFKCFAQKGIVLNVHYIPIPLQPYYLKNVPVDEEDYKNALLYYRSAITLPLYPALSDVEIDRVIDVVTRVLDREKN